MKIKFHHVNVVSPNQPELAAFYRDVLDLGPEPSVAALRFGDQAVGEADFVTDGDIQVHIAKLDPAAAFRTGQSINPVAHGHIAFRTDDLEAFIRRLDELGVPYADFDVWAMRGWRQIFFNDPAGNVIEMHQVVDQR